MSLTVDKPTGSLRVTLSEELTAALERKGAIGKLDIVRKLSWESVAQVPPGQHRRLSTSCLCNTAKAHVTRTELAHFTTLNRSLFIQLSMPCQHATS